MSKMHIQELTDFFENFDEKFEFFPFEKLTKPILFVPEFDLRLI